MRMRTAVRVGIRLIGVWLAATTVTPLFSLVPVLLDMAFGGDRAGIRQFGLSFWVSAAIIPLATLAVAWILMFRSEWLARLLSPTPGEACTECGYPFFPAIRDTSGSPPVAPKRCPECGAPNEAYGVPQSVAVSAD